MRSNVLRPWMTSKLIPIEYCTLFDRFIDWLIVWYQCCLTYDNHANSNNDTTNKLISSSIDWLFDCLICRSTASWTMIWWWNEQSHFMTCVLFIGDVNHSLIDWLIGWSFESWCCAVIWLMLFHFVCWLIVCWFDDDQLDMDRHVFWWRVYKTVSIQFSNMNHQTIHQPNDLMNSCKLDSSIDSSIKRWTKESIKRWTNDINTKRLRNRSNRSPQIEHDASNRFIESSILTLISRWFMTVESEQVEFKAWNDTSIDLPILYRSIGVYVQ